MKSLISALGLALLLYLHPSVVRAQAPLRAAVIDIEPWAIGKGRDLTGIEPQIFAELARRLGREIQLTILPIAREELDFGSGRFDLMLHASGPGYRKIGHELGEVGVLELVVVLPKGKLPETQSDLTGKKLAYVRYNANSAKFIRELGAVAEPVASIESGWQMAQMGRADGLFGSRVSITWNLNRIGVRRPDIGRISTVRQFSLQLCAADTLDPAVTEALTLSLAAMRADGSFGRVLEKFVARE